MKRIQHDEREGGKLHTLTLTDPSGRPTIVYAAEAGRRYHLGKAPGVRHVYSVIGNVLVDGYGSLSNPVDRAKVIEPGAELSVVIPGSDVAVFSVCEFPTPSLR